MSENGEGEPPAYLSQDDDLVIEAMAREIVGRKNEARRRQAKVAEPKADEETVDSRGPLERSLVSYDRRWMTEAPPPLEVLLRDTRTARPGFDGTPFLIRGTPTLLVAEGGIGKSLSMQALAISIATCTRWLGVFQPSAAGRVLILAGEESKDELHWRFHRINGACPHPVPPDGSIKMGPLEGQDCRLIAPDLYVNRSYSTTALWDDLSKVLQTAGDSGAPYDCAIIDTLSIFGGPDVEIDAHAATTFMSKIAGLKEYGTTPIVTHHTNKTSRGAGSEVATSSARGSTALTDRARCVWTMAYKEIHGLEAEEAERLGHVIVFSHAKSNRTVRAEPVQLRQDKSHGGVLLPLDLQDEKTVSDARAKDPKAEAKTQSRLEAGRADAVACAKALMASPGASRRALRVLLYPGLDLRKERVNVALELLKPAWAEEPGRNGGGKLELQKSLLPSWVLEKLA